MRHQDDRLCAFFESQRSEFANVSATRAIWARRYITTGVALPNGFVEVLSGLSGGEEVGAAEGAGR